MWTFPACFLALAMLALPGLSHGACPAKLSPALCPLYEAASESAFVRVRIMLDAKVESGFVWEKKYPPDSAAPRPLRAYSESLITKYDLRQPAHPESAYVRLYGANDPNPAIDQVLYHSASVTKANLGKLASEAYVAGVETFCGRRIQSSICSEINRRSDSDTLWIGIDFGTRLQSDAIARKAFMSKYALRDSGWANDFCQGRYYIASPASILAMAEDPDVVGVTAPRSVCIVATRRSSSPVPNRTRGSRPFRALPSDRRLDGRVLLP